VAVVVDGATAGAASDIVDGGEDGADVVDDLAAVDEVDVDDAEGADANDPPYDAGDPPYD
jgi:hypothetical protein